MHSAASDACVGACRRLVARGIEGVRLVVDADDLILREYLATLRSAKTSGPAVKLAQRLWRTRRSTEACRVVVITPLDDQAGSFEEVPAALRDFDVDDQKFLAVAVADGSTPPVFQALDEEWWTRRTDMTAAGIDVQFLCAADFMVGGA